MKDYMVTVTVTAAIRAKDDDQRAAQAERDRRAACYPDLLAALERIAEEANTEQAGEVLTGAYGGIAALEEIARAAIKKAKGEPYA